jgi:hypothetical protein
MGQLTNYTEKKVIDHLLKTTSFSPPAANSLFLGLSTANPTHDGSGWADPTYTGYARKAITFGSASARAITQNALVTFDPCTAGSSTVGYWGIWDLVSGGNLLAYGALATAKNIVAGNTPSVSNGQVSIDFSAGVIFTTIANSILGWLFAGGTLNQPTHVKVGLSTSTPADDGTNITEPSGNGYAQVNVDTWNAASGNPEAATNPSTITIGPPTGSWGQCTYSVLYLDTSPFMYGTITAQTPANGDTVEWLANQYSVGLQ